ncbi:MAG: MraY family glycosyltransferase [Bacteroidota bacterium]
MIITILLAISCAFALSYFLIPTLIRIAKEKQLFDVPDHRKSHHSPTPSMGGLAIFVGFCVASTLFAEGIAETPFRFLIVATFLMVLTGVYDDLLQMKAKTKALMQLLVASLLFFGGFSIAQVPGIPGLSELPLWLSYLLTTFFIMLIVNAYNLIDGIDGLAGSLGTASALVFAGLFYLAGLHGWCLLALALAASLLAFLRFNFFNASIFMGDTGSMLVGLLIAVFGISYLQAESNNSLYASNHLPLVIATVLLPVYDLARVFLGRLLSGKSPFEADQSHIQHQLMQLKMSTPMICTSLVIIQLFIVYCASWLTTLPTLLAIMVLTILTGEGLLLLKLLLRFRLRWQSKSSLSELINFKNKLKGEP